MSRIAFGTLIPRLRSQFKVSGQIIEVFLWFPLRMITFSMGYLFFAHKQIVEVIALSEPTFGQKNSFLQRTKRRVFLA
jgi:hypothetical protein